MMKSRTAILIMSLAVTATMWARDDWYETPITLPAGVTELLIDDMTVHTATLHLRVAMSDRHQAQWALVWNYKDSCNMCRALLSIPQRDVHEYITSSRVATLYVQTIEQGVVTTLNTVKVPGMDVEGDYNSLRLVYADGVATLMGGSTDTYDYCTVPFDPKCATVAVYCSEPAKCQRIHADFSHGVDKPRSRFVNIEALNASISKSSSPIVGIWEYMDRKTDTDKAMLGGRYKIAIVDNADAYDIIYLDGAEANAAYWDALDLKGRLTPTVFIGNYDMEWIDAYGHSVTGDSNAQLSADSAILTLRIPELKSEIRFRRALR